MAAESDALLEPEFHVILTPRLRLRTLRVSDAPALLPLISQDSVMRWTSHGVVTTEAEARRWTSDRALGKDVFNFAIELKNDGSRGSGARAIVGVVGSFHLPSVGYMIHPGRLSLQPNNLGTPTDLYSARWSRLRHRSACCRFAAAFRPHTSTEGRWTRL